MSPAEATLRIDDHRAVAPIPASEFIPLARQIHARLDVPGCAHAIANDGRLWAGWDRISVLLRHGSRWRVIAISGQEVVAPRSPTVLRLSALVRRLARAGRPWMLDRSQPSPPLAPETEDALAEYLAVASCERLRIEPLVHDSPIPISSPGARRSRAATPRPFGAIVLEDFAHSAVDTERDERTRALVQQSALALGHSLRYQRIFLRPFLSALGELWASITATRWILALVVLLMGAAAATALATIPAELQITAAGRLMPSRQTRIFAPLEAEVVELLVASGDRVEAGQPLLRLWDATLNEDLLLTRSRLATAEQSLHGAKAELHETIRTSTERSTLARLQTRTAQLEIEIQGLRSQLQLLEAEAEKLLVRAPAAGTVVTLNLRDRLLLRPVQRGDLLIELADDQSDWQLELLVPEREFGKFRRSREAVEPAQSRLEFRMVAYPQMRHAATVTELGARTIVDSAHGPCIPMTARVAEPLPENRQIGAEIEARLQGPETSLAAALFCDLIDAAYRWSWW